MLTTTLLSLAVLLVSSATVDASSICYDGYGREYYCDSGISYGARIGIGLGIAAAVLLVFALCGFWRRRSLKRQFSKYKPPALPFSHNNNPQSEYASNPPPPSNYNGNPYGSNPPPPPKTYQPSSAGQYGRSDTGLATGTGAGVVAGQAEHEHGYEWEQAREQERLEREQAGNTGANGVEGGDLPPPIYEVATSTHNTGAGANSSYYQPPVGPPPGKQAHTAL